MKTALIRPLALLAVAGLPLVPAAAAPSAGAPEAAAASFPLVTAAGAVELQVVADDGRLVLDGYDEAGLRRAVVELAPGRLVRTPDGATLGAVLDGVQLRVVWERVDGHLAVGTGSVTAGPGGAAYRGEVGDYAQASLQLSGGACASQWGSLGRAVQATTDDQAGGDVTPFAALLRSAACGESTATELPPER